MAERVFIVLSFLVIVVFLFLTSRLPVIEFSDPVGPKAFPSLTGIAGLIALALLFIERRKKRAPEGDGGEAPMPPRPAAIAAVVGWTFFYFISFETLGYLVATTIYLLVLMAYFNRGRWVANVAVSVLFSLGFLLLFNKFLQLRLPVGILGW